MNWRDVHSDGTKFVTMNSGMMAHETMATVVHRVSPLLVRQLEDSPGHVASFMAPRLSKISSGPEAVITPLSVDYGDSPQSQFQSPERSYLVKGV